MKSWPEQSMPTHLEHDLKFNSWRAHSEGPQACWHAWTFRQHASWKHVNPFHSLAACSRGSSAPLRAQARLEEAKTKVLREFGFSSKSWGLAGVLLRTGHKALLHDIIPGKFNKLPLTCFLDACTQVLLLGRIEVLHLSLKSCAIRFHLHSNKATHIWSWSCSWKNNW